MLLRNRILYLVTTLLTTSFLFSCSGWAAIQTDGINQPSEQEPVTASEPVNATDNQADSATTKVDADIEGRQEDMDQPNNRNWFSKIVVPFYTVIFGVAGAIILFSWLHVGRKLRQRTAALQILSEEIGLEFFPEGDLSLEESLATMPLFNLGRKKTLTNLFVADTQELNMSIFDYRFVTGHGRSRKEHRTTVLSCKVPKVTIPALRIRPRRKFLDAFGAMLGRQNISLPTAPEFSNTFILQSDDEETARTTLTAELIQKLQTRPRYSLQCQPGGFLYFHRNKRTDPNAGAYHQMMEAGLAISQALMNESTT